MRPAIVVVIAIPWILKQKGQIISSARGHYDHKDRQSVNAAMNSIMLIECVATVGVVIGHVQVLSCPCQANVYAAYGMNWKLVGSVSRVHQSVHLSAPCQALQIPPQTATHAVITVVLHAVIVDACAAHGTLEAANSAETIACTADVRAVL